ncbi:tRNA pseudouridine synthase [Basidiobolus meristosporus CBS 931.73]|uniref:tRNA pseudouridine synthase n=1 Tax=Basidiobolus meristosporus CBS 931.73 TaxID=1314790 RepID=A0A1Y1XVQ7_9FUNG|nr:tRNA pseudouridine synthase [Basidiobolus meristosporus CBS 931.73]|eukprot:ORX89839.1 tRNA pseudouridine synthase [Basidiobolus meristosporus CBS 931.73]
MHRFILSRPLAHLVNLHLLPSITRYRSMSTSIPGKYDSWSKEKLIEKLLEYEQREHSATPKTKVDSSVEAPAKSRKHELPSSENSPRPKSKKVKKEQRPFDITKYPKRHIALKVAYFGWNYYGFASQGEKGTVETVEDQLFRALLAARLIADPATCNYSRCGRTDKGVSGLGQVIALDVRSNIPQDESRDRRTEIDEIAYVDLINKQLPSDVRVVAWSPAEDSFNARFDCRSRKYKYFFAKGGLDVEKMREGAKMFLGSHDFRNFCKIDPAKQIVNYERTVLEADIKRVEGMNFSSPELELYELNLTGTAFLWHQVRCMMAVLFNVGQGLEQPSIVQQMLDVDTLPSKPNYEMASDIPLVLYDCQFDGLDWQFSSNKDMLGLSRLHKHIVEQWYTHTTQTLMFSTMYKELGSLLVKPADQTPCTWSEHLGSGKVKATGTNVILGGGRELRLNKYIPMIQRQRQEPFDILNARYNAKRQAKEASS